MTNKEAKEILVKSFSRVNTEEVFDLTFYTNIDVDEATLDGDFTKEQLVAISKWMENPQLVIDS